MAGAGSAAGAALGQTGAGKLISGLGGIGGLISIGSSIAGLLGGIGQKKRARKAMEEAEKLNPGVAGYESIANEAKQAARQGMSAQEYNLAQTGIERGTQTGLRQLGRMANPFAGISAVQRNQNDAFAQLNASNEGIKRQNRAASWQAQSQLQQARQQQYADAYNQAQALMGAGQQNTAGALGSLGQFGLMQSLYGQGNKGGNRNPSNNPLPAGGISTGGFNAWELPGARGGSALPGNNLSGYGSRLNAINPSTGRPYGK
jgi:hypothetical protein